MTWISEMIERYRQEMDDTNEQRMSEGYGTMDPAEWVRFFHPEEMEGSNQARSVRTAIADWDAVADN
jgi:hypothetical protein